MVLKSQDVVLAMGQDVPITTRKQPKTRLRLSQCIAAVLFICILLQSFRTHPSVIYKYLPSPTSKNTSTLSNPADEFKDDIWPIHQPTPWDISTDYPYPGTIEFDTEEGTWLRLDVHPTSGEIVFDMLGDLYCLPAKAYADAQLFNPNAAPSRAYPFLRGVPHDSDPHFSPDGKTLVFRSDAELGVENIWALKWKGCLNMDLEVDLTQSDLGNALKYEATDSALLASGVAETQERRHRRLLREGRTHVWRVTNETYRWVSDARFHPSSSKVIATKWYTSSRSLGAGEGWVYDVPAHDNNRVKPIEVGAGERLIGRTLPLGWTAEDYGDQQIGPEQFVWWGKDAVVYAKNVADRDGGFEYSKDVHSGIYAIFSYNLTTKATTTLVPSSPGGASRPELSRDGRTLAFVRRVRDKEALVLKDLHTGTLHHIWYGLTYDLSTVSAPMGTYPSFAFTPTSSGIVIWVSGKIWHVPLTSNSLGERISGGSPSVIPFRAHVLKKVADTVRSERDLVALDGAETQQLGALRGLKVDERGERAVFDAAGVTYYVDGIDWEAKFPTKHKFGKEVPVLDRNLAYYSPSFVPGRSDLVVHARWDDTAFSAFEIADLENGRAYEIKGLPMGRYVHPTVCACSGRIRQIAFVKLAGTLLTGSHVATAQPGLYVGNIVLPELANDKVVLKNLHFVPSEIDISDVLQMRFVDGNKHLLVQQSTRAFVIDFSAGSDALGQYQYPHTTLAEGRTSQEIAITLLPSRDGETAQVDQIAFLDFFHVFVVNGTSARESGEPVWSKPGFAPEGLARVSGDGGHGVTWTGDGKRVYWLLGPYLHSIAISKLDQCASAIAADSEKFGIGCLLEKGLIDSARIVVEYPTDVWRLRRDAEEVVRGRLSLGSRSEENSGLEEDEKLALANADVVVIQNATLLTMETRDWHRDLVRGASMVVRRGRIENVGLVEEVTVPVGATVFNAQGAYIVPGFIDVHAHWGGFDEQIPARSWELETFLAYGVTTLHNPSSDNNLGFVERGRVENGQMVGPRIFHTGNVIYGAGAPGYHNDVADEEEARSALIRIRAEGGYASFSYKNYNQYSRASRQRLLKAAKSDVNFSCYPEGGMNFDWDLTYIIDGMTTVEHALPVPELYTDVLYLYARSGTGATPTHIVNYGGAWGEQLVWAYMDVPNDPKLRRFTRHDILENLSETMIRPKDSYALFNTSASVAKMVHDGLRAHIGAHGEPPLGLNYHAEMYFTAKGGLSNFEVYRAATIDAAWTLGLDSSIGSLSSGKLADFVVYQPGVDLLEDDITASTKIKYVARGGRIWNADTMVEEWPLKGRKQTMPPINAD